MSRRWVLPLLVFSGFAGIAYELLWVRLLSLSLGSTTASFSIVLAVFFGGLALGARWGGNRSVTTTRPLAAYAALELLTGVAGLALYPVLTHLGGWVAALDPGQGFGGVVVRLLVSSIVLLPPTFLMGATLPFVSAATIDRDEGVGTGTALIYGLNTIGACLGAYAITFLLLPQLGIFKATCVTALLNFAVAGVAWALSRRSDGQAAPAPVADTQTAPETRRQVAVVLAATVGGFVATGAQIAWARFFGIVLRGTSYGIGSVLVAVLVGIGIGSLVAARFMREGAHLGLRASVLQLLVLVGHLGFLFSLPLIAYLIQILPNAGADGLALHHLDLGVVVVTLALPTIASGAVLPSLVAVAQKNARLAGKTLASLYSANTLGCIGGSLATAFVLLPELGSISTLYLMYLLLAVAAVVFVVACAPERRRSAAAIVVASLAGAAIFPQVDMRLLSSRQGTTLDYFSYWRSEASRVQNNVRSFYEGDVATVTVTKGTGVEGVTLNGLGQGTYAKLPPHIAHESTLVAAIPWVHARQTRRALIVGLGAGGTVDALLKMGVDKLEVAELERGVIDAVDEIWAEASPLRDPRVALIRNDARHHMLVQTRRAPHGYDFVTSMPAHPWVASALFSREFFALALDNLSEGGVFSTWFGPQNMPDSSVAALFGAFTSVFPHWLVYWVPEAGAFYLVGSNAPIRFDVARFDELGRNEAMAGLSAAAKMPTFFSSRVVASGSAPANTGAIATDDNGLIEFGVQRNRTTPPVESLAYFPDRGLPATLLTGLTDADSFLLATFETALRTPEGRLPLAGVAVEAARRAATPLLKGSSADLKAYAEFRVLLAEQKVVPAQSAAAGLTSEELKRRSGAFLAAAQADGPKKLETLVALPQTADVRATRLALAADLSGLPPLAPPQAGDDALGWLFVAPTAFAELSPQARADAQHKLVRRMAAFESVRLFEAYRQFLVSAGLIDEARHVELVVAAQRRADSQRALRRAFEAGAREKYAEAVALLNEAEALAPLTDPQIRLLLTTAVRIKDARTVERAQQLLRARGVAPEVIAAVHAEAVKQAASAR